MIAVTVVTPIHAETGFRALPRLTLWATKGALAILDQGLIAGSNFFIGILLARWLAPAQYGSYALAFAIFLLLSAVTQALLIEPQRIFGPSDYNNRLREYLGSLLHINVFLTALTSLGLVAAAVVIYLFAPSSTLSFALFGVAIAAPCILLMWLARGAFYVKLSPQYATAGGAIYCVVICGGMFALHSLYSVSPFSAFLVMGMGAIVSSSVLLVILRPTLRIGAGFVHWKIVLGKHWHYGRWVLASLVLNAVAGDIYYPLVSSFSGLTATGQLKALLNFYMLVAQTFSALSIFLLPYACRVLSEHGIAALRRLTWKMSALFALLAFGYWTALVLLSTSLLQFVYGGRYLGLSSLVIWVAAASLPWNLAVVPTIALRAVRSSASIFVIYCASSAVSILVGIPLTWVAGLRGALWAMIASNLAALVVAIVLARSKMRTMPQLI